MSVPTLLAMTLALAAPPSANSTAPARVEVVKISNAFVMTVAGGDLSVPAKAAGVLASLDVQEGSHVETDALLGQIDARDVQLAKKAAELDHEIAVLQADSDANVAAAVKTAEVAKAEFLGSNEINTRNPGTISRFELDRLRLTWDRMVAQHEIAQLEKQVAGITSSVKATEVAATEHEIEKRRIQAPFPGTVAEILRGVGEWVNPGDPVLRLVRMDRVRVQGAVPAADYAPHQVFGKPVMVEVRLANGQVEKFQGQISYVSPFVEGDHKYRFYCEVENRKIGNFWILRPGLLADMVLQLDQTAARPAAR